MGARVALDGTKIHANASRHSALGFVREHARHEDRGNNLKTEVADLLARAEAADQTRIFPTRYGDPRGTGPA